MNAAASLPTDTDLTLRSDRCRCGEPLPATSAVAVLHRMCVSCYAVAQSAIHAAKARATQAAAVRLVDSFARVAAQTIPTLEAEIAALPRLIWSRSANVVTAVYGDERANYRVEAGSLVEANGRLPDEAFAELEYDVFGNQHYRGEVPRAVAGRPLPLPLPDDGAPRADMLEAFGFGLCACGCGELAIDCRKAVAS